MCKILDVDTHQYKIQQFYILKINEAKDHQDFIFLKFNIVSTVDVDS